MRANRKYPSSIFVTILFLCVTIFPLVTDLIPTSQASERNEGESSSPVREDDILVIPTIDIIGLNRPTIDGRIDDSRPHADSIGEWGDSTEEAIVIGVNERSATVDSDSQIEATLRQKKVNDDLYISYVFQETSSELDEIILLLPNSNENDSSTGEALSFHLDQELGVYSHNTLERCDVNDDRTGCEGVTESSNQTSLESSRLIGYTTETSDESPRGPFPEDDSSTPANHEFDASAFSSAIDRDESSGEVTLELSIGGVLNQTRFFKWSLIILLEDKTVLHYPETSSSGQCAPELNSEDRIGWFEKECYRVDRIDFVTDIYTPRSDSAVIGIEVTQAIQTADMRMRLVQNKTSLARVYIESGTSTVAEVSVTLKACWRYSLGSYCPSQLQKTHLAPPQVNRSNIFHSANFVLPQEWVSQETLVLHAEIELLRAPAEDQGITNAANVILEVAIDPNDGNNDLIDTFHFNETRNLKVFVLPMYFYNNQGDRRDANLSRIDSYMNYAESIFPSADLEVKVLPTEFGGNVSGLTENSEKIERLKEVAFLFDLLDQIHQSSGLTDSPFEMDQLLGALSMYPTYGQSNPVWNGGTSIVSLCSAGNSEKGWDICAAHEIMHNLGPSDFDGDGDGFDADGSDQDWGSHLGACTKNWDQVWIENFGTDNWTIQDIGWDSNALQPDINQSSLIPAEYPDLMGYCKAGHPIDTPPWFIPYATDHWAWISTYRWEYMYDKFLNWEVGEPYHPYGKSNPTNSSFRVISGVIPYDGNSGFFTQSWSGEGSVPVKYREYGEELRNSNYSIVIKDGDGDELQKIQFNEQFDGHHNGTTDFQFTFFIQDHENIATIELLDSDGTKLDELTYSESPQTQIHALGTSEMTRGEPRSLSWDSAEGDDVRYQLEYSWDDNIWIPIGSPTLDTTTEFDIGGLPGGESSKLRIRAMDGLATYYTESSTFRVDVQDPTLRLLVDGQDAGSDTLPVVGGRSIEQETQPQIRDSSLGDMISLKADVSNSDFHPVRSDGYNWSVVLRGDIIDIQSILSSPLDSSRADQSSLRNSESINIVPILSGEYEISVKYTDSNGRMAEKSATILVNPPVRANESQLASVRSEAIQVQNPEIDYGGEELRYYAEVERSRTGDDTGSSNLNESDLERIREDLGISEEVASQMGRDIEAQRTVSEESEKESDRTSEKSSGLPASGVVMLLLAFSSAAVFVALTRETELRPRENDYLEPTNRSEQKCSGKFRNIK
jgi:hypothetical protein